MTRKEKIMFGVVTAVLIGSWITMLITLLRYFDLKVSKYRIQESLSDYKSRLELSKQENEEKAAKIKELNSVVKKFSGKVSSLQKQIKKLQNEKEQLEEKIDEIKSQYEDVDKLVKSKDADIFRLKREVARLRVRLKDIEERLAAKQKEYEVLVKSGGKVDLQNIKVVKSDKGKGRDEKIASLIGENLNSKVLVVNKRYNFAVIGVNAPAELEPGWKVMVQKESGDSFTSVIDSVKQNMATIDVPSDIDLVVGEVVSVVLEGKL